MFFFIENYLEILKLNIFLEEIFIFIGKNLIYQFYLKNFHNIYIFFMESITTLRDQFQIIYSNICLHKIFASVNTYLQIKNTYIIE